MSFSIHGLAVSRGIAIGRAVLVASSRADVAHYFIEADQAEQEVQRIRLARDAVMEEISRVQRELPSDAPAELAALLDVHLMLLRALSYREDSLDALVARTLAGASQGVMQVAVTAPQNQNRRSHDQDQRDHQQ